MRLTSDAFTDGGTMPHDYTADGNNHSPPLKFHEVPTAAGLAVSMEREARDGATEVHWMIFDLPPLTAGLARAEIAGRYRDAINGFQRIGYSGPRAHEDSAYIFRLFALDTLLGLPNGTPAEEVRAAMNGHIIAEACLTGRYASQAPLPDRNSPRLTPPPETARARR